MQTSNGAAEENTSDVRQDAGKLTLKLRRLNGDKRKRMLLIYRGDVTHFDGDAIINAGTVHLMNLS
jgi:hypothetical protein